MNILLLVPVWKRPEIVDIFYKGYLENKSYLSGKGINLILTPILSEEDEHFQMFTEFFKDHFISVHENFPLGAKKNHGLKTALNQEWEYLIELGSDDLMSNALWDLYIPEIEKETSFFGVKEYWIFDYLKKDLYRFDGYKTGVVIGGGRMIHRSLCERPLWRKEARRGMDTHSEDFIWFEYGITPKQIESSGKPYLLDIKTRTNLHTVHSFKTRKFSENLYPEPFYRLDGYFPAELLDLCKYVCIDS